VPGWEWTLAVVCLFVLGRTSVLFYRERVADLIGAGRAGPIWNNDPVIRVVFAVTLLAVYVLAARRCNPRNLFRLPFLVAFLSFAFASVTWSVEPTTSLWRALLFLGTALFGWYLGERYTLRELIGIVGAFGAIAAVESTIAIFVWPDTAQATKQVMGRWSGVFVNRNLLALVMATGLLAIPFLWSIAPRRGRILLIAVGGAEIFLLLRSGSVSPWVGLAGSAVAALALLGVRIATTRHLKPVGGAFGVFVVAGYVALVVQWNWRTILAWLGRRPDLTGRTGMWFLDNYFAWMQPIKGWGFEAVWSHPPTIAVALEAFGSFPYSSHSGYYEILLSTGFIGLGLFAGFLVSAGWRAFRYAWRSRDIASLWPFVFIVFAVVMNFSESLFVSSEAIWALTVAAAVAANRRRGRPQTVS
jgi:O-antigen ligase